MSCSGAVGFRGKDLPVPLPASLSSSSSSWAEGPRSPTRGPGTDVT
ncbi:MAG: hypothetical protein RXO24_06360 [Acidilobus sp.]